ncbi:MAG: PH domain-containing protein [Synergistaceae bacterium]|nr:PH domain-containing protein [Synergistaceae bacterium]
MEPFYRTYKPAKRGFYKLWLLVILILVLAWVVNHYNPGADWCKWIWYAAAAVDVLIVLYILVKRMTISLTLKDNPEKPSDQEVSFSELSPLKPFSSDFSKSIEIGLMNIEHIEVKQTLMQKILGIGDIIIASSGTGREEIIAPGILHPVEVRDEIQEHASRYKAKI